MEVGPLARTLLAYAAGKPDVKAAVDGALAKLSLPPAALFSTMGRIAARALEAEIMVGHLSGWVAQLDDNNGSAPHRGRSPRGAAGVYGLGNRTYTRGGVYPTPSGGSGAHANPVLGGRNRRAHRQVSR
jgi:Ni,Fe-hydrogenase I large subunit